MIHVLLAVALMQHPVVSCETTEPPPWDKNCHHVDIPGVGCAKDDSGAWNCDKPAPLKCGKYQHVEHWPGQCGPTPCDEKTGICLSVCAPIPADHCADDLHTVTEKEWQQIMARLKALEKR